MGGRKIWPTLEREQRLWDQGLRWVAGVDEAGRGPLAGPVVVAAVMVAPGVSIHGVDDSKKLSPLQREQLFEEITANAGGVGVTVVPVSVIDEINIFQATMKGMRDVIGALNPTPEHVFIDGPHSPLLTVPGTPVIDGDACVWSIAAASIIAKVTRDRIMLQLHEEYPQYGFDRHKGYGTAGHLQALRMFGPCPHHRKSFHMPQREERYTDENTGSGKGRGG